jgi:hypothetical protein
MNWVIICSTYSHYYFWFVNPRIKFNSLTLNSIFASHDLARKRFSTTPQLFSDRPALITKRRQFQHFQVALWYSTRKAIFILAFRFYLCSNWNVSFSSFYFHLGCASAEITMKTSHFSLAKIRRKHGNTIYFLWWTINWEKFLVHFCLCNDKLHTPSPIKIYNIHVIILFSRKNNRFKKEGK